MTILSMSDVSYGAVTLALNLLLQSSLLIGVGWAASGLLRKRGAAPRSTVLRVTLVAVLLCPLASLLLEMAGVPGAALHLPRADPGVEESKPAAVFTTQDSVDLAPMAPPLLTVEQAPSPVRVDVGPAPARVSVEGAIPVQPVQAPEERRLLASAYTAIAAAWFLLVCGLLTRLALAHTWMMRLRRQARPVPAPLTRTCAEIARDLHIPPPRLCTSPRVKSPCLVGLFRPAILLPEGSERAITEILVHELAHLRRRDCLWNFVGRITRALIPFQPLVWRLTRRIEELSDEVADDYVVQEGLNRHRYAHHLIDIAARFAPSRSEVITGVGVIAFKSVLGHRVQRILDTKRRLSVHTGTRAVAAIILTATFVTLAAGLIGAEGQDAKQTALTVSADGTGDYGSIQAAIDAASDHDIVHVGPGIYEERVSITRPLTLEGVGWDRTTILTRNRMLEVLAPLEARIEGAENDAERKNIVKEAEAIAEEVAQPVLLVENTAGVVLRGIRFSWPGPHREGRLLDRSMVSFRNARAVMTDCAIIESPASGIEVSEGSDVEIRDCLVAAVWSTGITVAGDRDGAGARARIIDSDIRNCHHRGIVIGRGGDATLVEGCRISGSAWHGIRYDHASPTITGNVIFQNARSGIYASGATAATVTGNLFYQNEMDAISCWFQNRDTIEGNTFAQNLREGLAVLGASEPVVRRNIFFGHPVAIRSGNIGGDSPHAKSTGTLHLEQNLFWDNALNLVKALASPVDGQSEPSESLEPGEGGSIIADPLFTDADALDFSLTPHSPARERNIGVAAPVSVAGPWPLQPEERAIIPRSDTRDYRQWKPSAELPSTSSGATAQETGVVGPRPSIALLYHEDAETRIATVHALSRTGDATLIDDLIRARCVEAYTPVKLACDDALRVLTGARERKSKGAWKAWVTQESEAGRLSIDYAAIDVDALDPSQRDKIALFAARSGPEHFDDMATTLSGVRAEGVPWQHALRYMVLNDHRPEVQAFLGGPWLQGFLSRALRPGEINALAHDLNGLADPGPVREQVNARVRACLHSENSTTVTNALHLLAGVEGFTTVFTVPGVEGTVRGLVNSDETRVAVQAKRALEKLAERKANGR